MTCMKRLAALFFGLALAAGGAAASARADGGLEEEAQITSGLVVLAAADKIRRACDDIGARFFKARRFAEDLKAFARARGYSPEEIDAYINDRDQKARIRALRNAYFESKGASNLDPESLCALGEAEIAGKSLIGHLLKAK